MNKEKNSKKQDLTILFQETDKTETSSCKVDSYENTTFEKYKKKKKGIQVFATGFFGVLLISGFGITFLSEKFNTKKEMIDYKVDNFEEYKKGKISGNISQAMNNTDNIDIVKNKEINAGHFENKNIRKNKNYQKDEEILQKYATAVDSAADEKMDGGNRSGRRNFIPGGSSTQGGVFIKKNSEDVSKKAFDIHNLQIKVKLEFSIRSTAASSVVATVVEENGAIEKGAKFYGNATGYVNKRTQLSFSRLIINGSEYRVKGFAISGRDPGIESEVTDISKENINSSVKQGIVQTVSNIAVKYAGAAGSVGTETASNTVDPASSEMQKQAEANKMTQEYRVPAGTSFFIYLE